MSLARALRAVRVIEQIDLVHREHDGRTDGPIELRHFVQRSGWSFCSVDEIEDDVGVVEGGDRGAPHGLL